jgi:hypothetical protein
MQLIPKLQTGYAYASLRSLGNVIVRKEEPNRFIGFAYHEGQKYGRFRIGKKTVLQLCFPNATECKHYAFNESDIQPSDSWDGRISCNREMLFDCPLWYHTRGLSQTASGYGRKLTTTYCMHFNGRLHRVYCCCFSNSGTCYIVSKGRKIIVDA